MTTYPVRLALAGMVAACCLAPMEAIEDGHVVSPGLSAAIADGLPKFDPAPKLTDVSLTAVPPAQSESSSLDAVWMPEYVVRESKPLNEDQLLLITGKANIAMNRYLGDTNSLDRGILNHFTFPELWSEIPVLKFLPCPLPGLTNQQRALARYREDERLSLKDDLISLESLDRSSMDENSRDLKREIRYTLRVGQIGATRLQRAVPPTMIEGQETQRLFVAIPLPDAVREALRALAEPLHGVSWVRREQLHVTVRFLGDVATDKVEGMCERLGDIRVEPFILPVESVGAFLPSVRHG